MGKLIVRARVFDGMFDYRDIVATGRYGQTLKALVEAGERGVTALEMSNWALRLSHYVFILRTDPRYALDIETRYEDHEVNGMGPGRHGRYFLHSYVQLVSDRLEAAE